MIKRILFTTFLCYVSLQFNPLIAQIQIGDEIDGEAAMDLFGEPVVISSNGTRIASGAIGNGENSGHVRVFDLIGGNWEQVGSDIDGENSGDASGFSVSLSSSGNRIAIGAPSNDIGGVDTGYVRIFDLIDGNWVQIGSSIEGENSGDLSGYSVSLSSEGNRIAISAIINNGNGEVSGHVRIFDFSEGNWIQLGSDIDGEAEYDYSGYSIGLSANGDKLIIGAFQNDGNGDGSGHARIFRFTGADWIQMGSDIDGEAAGDESGEDVAISSNGNIVAIGAHVNDGNGLNSGHVRVYKYNGSDWDQLGDDIDSESPGDRSGHSVSLSSDGNILAVGAVFNDASGSNSGHVRIFQLIDGNWVQIGEDIDGETAGDFFGISVALSADGRNVVIGGSRNDGNGFSSGHLRVFGDLPLSVVDELNETEFVIYPNPVQDILGFSDVEFQINEIKIYSIIGKLVKSISNEVNILSTIDVSDLVSGVYLIHFKSKDKTSIKKFIKQ